MTSHRKSKVPGGSGGFKTYIDLQDFEERAVDVPEEPEVIKAEAHLLPGEVVIAEANNVLKFAPLKTNKGGISGTLFVTNFKVSFVTSLPIHSKESELYERSLQSHFLGEHDVCLSEVETVRVCSEELTKKKWLSVGGPVPSRLPGLQLVLKNLRIIFFSFKFTPAGQEVRLTQTLLHHAFPVSVDHLFLSGGHVPPPSPAIPEFCSPEDWERELERTRCPNWRVSKHNEYFNLCPSLPVAFVVPRDLLDVDMEHAAQHFRGTRPPVWCWGCPTGAALVRMAQIAPTITDKGQENRMIAVVHRSHPQRKEPTIMDLDTMLPSLRDIQSAYLKLRELHTPDDPTQFMEQDRHYNSRWEASRWLAFVSQCLDVAQKAANTMLHSNSSVILQDLEGRDLSAVVSSLVQLLLDPYTRTLRGFHTLVQKEWVALGHQFAIRLGHTRSQPLEEQSVVWLLFLDCVHQVGQQHPGALQFTSQYLVALWHASHCSLYSTFMFNSVNHRSSSISILQRESHEPVHLLPVWCWWARELPAQPATLAQTNGVAEDPPDGLSLGRLGHAREAFLNVHYVTGLLRALAVERVLSRVQDPLSSAHTTWQRLNHLLGGSGPLPYDPRQPMPPLTLDNSLRVDGAQSSMRPWKDCFCAWTSEPATLSLLECARVLRRPPPSAHYWHQVYLLHHTLTSLLSPTFHNGTLKHLP